MLMCDGSLHCRFWIHGPWLSCISACLDLQLHWAYISLLYRFLPFSFPLESSSEDLVFHFYFVTCFSLLHPFCECSVLPFFAAWRSRHLPSVWYHSPSRFWMSHYSEVEKIWQVLFIEQTFPFPVTVITVFFVFSLCVSLRSSLLVILWACLCFFFRICIKLYSCRIYTALLSLCTLCELLSLNLADSSSAYCLCWMVFHRTPLSETNILTSWVH